MDRERRLIVEGSARTAGDLKRYHTWPVLQAQTIAAHTWHVMRIYWEIFGPPPSDTTTYLLWHDAGEAGRGPGDIPFGSKQVIPEFGMAAKELEHQQLVRVAGREAATTRPEPYELVRCKVCDLLEMWEFGLKEVLMGNLLARPIVSDTMDSVLEKMPELAEPDQEVVTIWIDKSRANWSERVWRT